MRKQVEESVATGAAAGRGGSSSRSSMIAGGLAHEAEDVVTEVGTRPRKHGLLMAGSGCGPSPKKRSR